MELDLASLLVGGGLLTVLGSLVGIVLNNVFDFLKGRDDRQNTRADTAKHFEELASKWTERFEERNEELIAAIEELIDAVDRALPALELIAGQRAEVIDLRRANSKARRVV